MLSNLGFDIEMKSGQFSASKNAGYESFVVTPDFNSFNEPLWMLSSIAVRVLMEFSQGTKIVSLIFLDGLGLNDGLEAFLVILDWN